MEYNRKRLARSKKRNGENKMKKINKIRNFMSDSKQEVLNIRNFLPVKLKGDLT